MELSRCSLPFRVLMVLLLLPAGIGGSIFARQAPPPAQSLTQLEEAVRLSPDDAESRRRLGAALHRSGQLQRAIEEYEAAIRLSPGEVELYLGLAGVFEAANLTREAEELLLNTSEAFPRSVTAAVELAEVRFASGKVEKALEAFEAARMVAETVSGREQAFIYRRIGEMHVHMIEFDEALAAYENALRLAPGNSDIHLALGKLYLRRNRLEDALGEYGLAIARDPENLPAHEGIAEAYLRLEQFEKSIAAAETAIGIDPEHLGSHYLRATALVRSGRDEDARLALDVYRNLETESRIREQREREIGGIYKAALAEALDGNGAEAVRLLREGIETHPDASELHMNLGATLNSLGRYSEAVEVFERMIDSGMRDDPLIQRSLAKARELQGDADR